LGLSLQALEVTEAPCQQLNLSRVAAGLSSDLDKGPEALPVLWAELAADIGLENFGVLKVGGSHCPEKRSQLGPIPELDANGGSVTRPRATLGARHTQPTALDTRRPTQNSRRNTRSDSRKSNSSFSPAEGSRSQLFESSEANFSVSNSGSSSKAPAEVWTDPKAPAQLSFAKTSTLFEERLPTRLLPAPVALEGTLEVGETLFLQGRPFQVQTIEFERRLEELEWWSKRPISRDYYRVKLAKRLIDTQKVKDFQSSGNGRVGLGPTPWAASGSHWAQIEVLIFFERRFQAAHESDPEAKDPRSRTGQPRDNSARKARSSQTEMQNSLNKSAPKKRSVRSRSRQRVLGQPLLHGIYD
jgi:hypothetical protein